MAGGCGYLPGTEVGHTLSPRRVEVVCVCVCVCERENTYVHYVFVCPKEGLTFLLLRTAYANHRLARKHC